MDLDDVFAQFEKDIGEEPADNVTSQASSKPSGPKQKDGKGTGVISASPVVHFSGAEKQLKRDERIDNPEPTQHSSHVIPEKHVNKSHRADAFPRQQVGSSPPTSSLTPSALYPTPHPQYNNLVGIAPIPAPPPPSVAQQLPNATNREKKSAHVRTAAGEVWRDNTLSEWPENDFRIFVGDLGKDSTDAQLTEAFEKYKSFNKAKVIKDKRTGLCKGYGFVSLQKGEDMVLALKQMNGKYIAGRPVKLKKSNWMKRELTSGKRKEMKILRQITKR